MAQATGRMNQSAFRAFNRLAARNTKQLLNDGFLDTLGASGKVNPVALNSLEEVLEFYGGELIKAFGEELDKQDKDASGFLRDSMRFEVDQKGGKSYELRVLMADYASYVDEGVQGIDSGKNVNSTSRFKFKFRNPSTKHVDALEKWIRQKNVTALIVVPKGIDPGTMQPRDLAYIFAKATKKRGLKATYFKKNAVESLIDDMKADIAKAMAVDVKVNILFE